MSICSFLIFTFLFTLIYPFCWFGHAIFYIWDQFRGGLNYYVEFRSSVSRWTHRFIVFDRNLHSLHSNLLINSHCFLLFSDLSVRNSRRLYV